MTQTAHVLTLSPAADTRQFDPCPRGCMGHEDTAAGRRHVGMRAALSAKTPAGALADVDLRAEYHDDGHGNARGVFVLQVAGGPTVELETSSMHWLLRKWDNAFWSLAPRRSMTRLEADEPVYVVAKGLAIVKEASQ